MKRINKGDMAARAVLAASHTPPEEKPPQHSFSERLGLAKTLGDKHPLRARDDANDATSPIATAVAEVVGNEGRGGQYQEVSLDLIDPNPFNARHIYEPDRIAEVAASIAANGQDTPGAATIRNGRYVLAAGHYRFKALRKLSAKTMKLMIHLDLTDRELYALSYRENAERSAQTSLDNALAWHDLIDKGVYNTQTEIAEALGLKQPTVAKIMRALELKDSVMAVVREAPQDFAMTVLYELVMLQEAVGEERAVFWARKVLSDEIGRKDIAEARAKEAQGTTRKIKENSRQYKILSGEENIGSIKDWDSGRVTLDVKLADAKQRQELVVELRKRFGLNE